LSNWFVAISTPEFTMFAKIARRLLLVSLSVVAAACAALTSTTTIDPNKAFRLGGGQPGAFTVRGKNVGSVAVVVFTEVDGKRDSVLTVAPGASVNASFPAKSMAVFMNTSSAATAMVAIKVTGDIRSLGMGYEANPKR
jgi:hypothetical protein